MYAYQLIWCGTMTLFTTSQLFARNLCPLNQLVRPETRNDDNLVISVQNLNNIRSKNIQIPGDKATVHLKLRQYQGMKLLSFLVNKLVGSSVTCFVALTCLYTTTDLDDMLSDNDEADAKYYSHLIRWMFYKLSFVIILILAAEVSTKA